jgi:putative hemin transport protein
MDGLLSISSGNGLAARWRRLRDVDPSVTLATAAYRLDVAEAALVASLCGDGALRLDAPFGDVVRILPMLGRVRAVTRNPHATIETRGVYPEPEVGCAGVAGEIGARFFLDHWEYGYALDPEIAPDRDGALVFYDGRGRHVHEVYAETETRRDAFARLVDIHASFDQSPGENIALASPHLLTPRTDLGAWLRQAEDARPVALGSLAGLLDEVRREALPVSLAVRSPGVVQRFSGLMHDVSAAGTTVVIDAPWVRVCVTSTGIAEAWVVRTPSLDGPATSLELLDASASVVLSVSGARWPGKPELAPWRELLERLKTAQN